MPYSTLADVQQAVGGADRLVQLADWNGTGAADPDIVDSAIAEADALINSFAAKRYAVPLVAVTVDLVKLSARHAARTLRRDRGQVLASDVTDEKNDRDWLKMLANGEVFLGADPQPPKSSATVDKAAPRDSTALASRERLKGYW